MPTREPRREAQLKCHPRLSPPCEKRRVHSCPLQSSSHRFRSLSFVRQSSPLSTRVHVCPKCERSVANETLYQLSYTPDIRSREIRMSSPRGQAGKEPTTLKPAWCAIDLPPPQARHTASQMTCPFVLHSTSAAAGAGGQETGAHVYPGARCCTCITASWRATSRRSVPAIARSAARGITRCW
jgi:hypothetical protein